MGRIAAGARLAKSAAAARLWRANAGARLIPSNDGLHLIRSSQGRHPIRFFSNPPQGGDLHPADQYISERLSAAIGKELRAIRSDLDKRVKGTDPSVPIHVEQDTLVGKELTSEESALEDPFHGKGGRSEGQMPPEALFNQEEASFLKRPRTDPAEEMLIQDEAKAGKEMLIQDEAKAAKEMLIQDEAKAAKGNMIQDEADAARLEGEVTEEIARNDADSSSKEAKQAAEAKKLQRRKEVTERNKALLMKRIQRKIDSMFNSIQRLDDGSAPRQLRHISTTVDSIKSTMDKETAKITQDKLWIYVVWEQIRDKLPRWMVLCFATAYAIWSHFRDLYPFWIILMVLCTFTPVQLYQIAHVDHADYVTECKKKLKEYERRQKLKAEERRKLVEFLRYFVLFAWFELGKLEEDEKEPWDEEKKDEDKDLKDEEEKEDKDLKDEEEKKDKELKDEEEKDKELKDEEEKKKDEEERKDEDKEDSSWGILTWFKKFSAEPSAVSGEEAAAPAAPRQVDFTYKPTHPSGGQAVGPAAPAQVDLPAAPSAASGGEAVGPAAPTQVDLPAASSAASGDEAVGPSAPSEEAAPAAPTHDGNQK